MVGGTEHLVLLDGCLIMADGSLERKVIKMGRTDSFRFFRWIRIHCEARLWGFLDNTELWVDPDSLVVFEYQLILSQGTCLVAEDVVRLRKVLMKGEVPNMSTDCCLLVDVDHCHPSILLYEEDVHEPPHFEANRKIKWQERVVD